MHRAAVALLLVALAGAGQADDAPLAGVHSNNGSVPPPYHEHMRVTVAQDGTVTLRACQGYGEGDCITRRGSAAPAALEAIRAAAIASGLAERPAADDPMPPVGGGSMGGHVLLEAQRIDLPAFPAAADRDRVGAVLSAIMAAVPAEMPRSDPP